MDEITLNPTPKTEDGSSPKNEKANYEMDPIVVSKNPEPEKPAAPKDIQAMMEAEKKARQESANAAQKPVADEQEEVAPPTAKKPDSSSKSAEKIVEIMLSPPSSKPAADAAKAENAPVPTRSEDVTESETDKAPAEKKPAPKKKKAPAKPKEETPVTAKEENVPIAAAPVNNDKKEIDTIDIPVSLADSAKASKPVSAKTQESSIEGLNVSKPVFVDIDSNVAQAVDPESYNEEFKRLMSLEETNSLSPDEKRRLQIIRLIELKKKGKSNPFANDNLVALMSEERSAGHDVSTFDKALAELNGTPVAQPAKAPVAAVAAQTMNAQPIKPQPSQPPKAQSTQQPVINKPAPVKQEVVSTPAKSEKNFPVVPVIIVAAIVVVGIILAVVLLGGKGNVPNPDETSVSETTVSTNETPVETTIDTTTEATELISVGNIIDATVTEVLSGDSFKATIDGDTYTIRMIGIASPDGKEFYAKEAKAYTEKIIGSKNITLEFDTQINNPDNELLAYVWYNNGGVLFNDELIMLGYAKTNLDDINKKFNDEFTKMEESAKGDKKGMWNPQTTVVAKKTTTAAPSTAAKSPYVSRNLKVFHKNTCPLAFDSRYGANIFEFSSREEAIEFGCKPCVECNP